MTDTPKTIWRVAAYIPRHNDHGLASWPVKDHAGDGAVEYTLTTHSDALVAAAYEDAATTIVDLQAENAKLREALTAKDAIRWLKLIRDQDQGCGGRLNPQEIYLAMKREANNALSALSGQDAEGET